MHCWKLLLFISYRYLIPIIPLFWHFTYICLWTNVFVHALLYSWSDLVYSDWVISIWFSRLFLELQDMQYCLVLSWFLWKDLYFAMQIYRWLSFKISNWREDPPENKIKAIKTINLTNTAPTMCPTSYYGVTNHALDDGHGYVSIKKTTVLM